MILSLDGIVMDDDKDCKFDVFNSLYVLGLGFEAILTEFLG